jgi:hypothetical protein
MTSDEIRVKVNNVARVESVEYFKIIFLGEIAYQLAKLHEHFEAVDNHVFGDDALLKKERNRRDAVRISDIERTVDNAKSKEK